MEQQLVSVLSLSGSLSLSLSPSTPREHLLHHCSATINSSVQISCKRPKQTSGLTSAPQHTHVQVTQVQTSSETAHALAESPSNTHWTTLYWYLLRDLDGNRQAQPRFVFDLIAADISTCFSNLVPSKNGSADVNLFNDKLLMSLSTLWFTSVLFTSLHGEAPQGTCTLTPVLSAPSKRTG